MTDRYFPKFERDDDRWHDHPILEGRLPTESEWSVTVLRSVSRRLTKLVKPNGEIVAIDNAKTFAAVSVDIENFDDVHELLRKLTHRRDCAVVLGALVDTANRSCMRRLRYADPKIGDLATLRDVPRRFFCLDVDTVSAPVGIDLTNLESAARIVRDAMPPPFRKAKCIAVATSSYLIKDGLRVRLWFYFDRPMTCGAMKQWLRWLKAPVDFAPLHPAALNYTAAPIFEDASQDPLPNGRIVVLDGSKSVTTPDQRDIPELLRHTSNRSTRRLRGGTSALIRVTVAIRNAEAGERHNTIMRVVHWLAEAVEQGSVSEEDAECCLREAGARIGMPDDETLAMFRHALARKRDRFSFEDERQQ